MGFTWLLTVAEHTGSVASTASGTILPKGFFLATGLLYILALGLHRLASRLAIASALPILALALVVYWLHHGLKAVSHGQVETLHTTSLALLLFYAGLNTDLERIRGRLALALALPTIGILLSAPLLGLLLFIATVRDGGSWRQALIAGCLWPSLFSYFLEVAQHFLPTRVPSARDWAFNTVGAVCGCAMAWLLQATGLLRAWQRWRERWFQPDSAGAIALLVLWPIALLFPLPVVLGVGQITTPLRLVWDALSGLPADLGPLIPPAPLSAAHEALAIMLGLLSPSLLAIVVTRSLGQRLVMVTGVALVALGGTTLSTALNFSPDHALAWVTPSAIPAGVAALDRKSTRLNSSHSSVSRMPSSA